MRKFDEFCLKFFRKPLINIAYYEFRMERLINIYRCMEYLHWLSQNKSEPAWDYCEFGVASGKMLINSYYISKKYPNLSNMRFIGFDSFEGLPSFDHEFDKIKGWKKGDFAFDIETVKRNLKKAKIPENKYILVKGLFKDSLNEIVIKENNIKQIAYTHIDCDLYTSTKTALNFIKPYLIEGAIIDFDDYYCYPTHNQGEPQAFKEFLKENPDIIARPFFRYSSNGEVFTVSRKKTK